MDGEAAWLVAHASGLLAQQPCDGRFTTFAGMEAGEDVQVRGASVLRRS